MLKKNMERGVITRRELEEKIARVGDYVKMDYLQSALKSQLDFDTRRFALTKLAQIYEARKMYLEAGKLMRAAAEINVTFDGKIGDYMKSVDLLIKYGAYDEADISFSKAMGSSTEIQKNNLKAKRKDMVRVHAEDCVKRDKRAHALAAYEKLMEIPELMGEEKKRAQTALLDLYQKLGKVREFASLRNSMN